MDNEYMQKAIEEAYEGIKKGDGGPFGAVIVKDGKWTQHGPSSPRSNGTWRSDGNQSSMSNA